MATLNIIVTDAGRAEIVNATNNGTLPVVIDTIALGTGKWTPDTTATALNTPLKTINAIGGLPTAADTLHVTITDQSTDVYSLGEVGLYTDTGVLFAIYSDLTGITDKAADALLLLSADIVLTSVTPGNVTITGPGFVNPVATETTQGVAELATPAEVQAGTDTVRIVTPAGLASVLSGYSPTSHTHPYEPAFAKLSGFNKNFGTTAGTVAEGNHTHPYEPAFAKLSAFNKSFGITAGTVAEGNHTHAFASGSPLPPRYLSGLTLANNTVDPVNDINIAPGFARDDTDTVNLVLTATRTKQLDAAWAVGNNAGGLFSGVIAASTWYHFFLIRRDSDGLIDAGFDTSPTAANRPAGYTYFRRIGSVKTTISAAIEPFFNVGNLFSWRSANILDYISATASALYTLNVPTGIRVLARSHLYVWPAAGGGSASISVKEVGVGSYPWFANGNDDGTYTSRGQISLEILTDVNAQIASTGSGTFQSIQIRTAGWIDYAR